VKRRTEKSVGKGGERGDRARERSGATPSPSPRFFPRRANPLPFPPSPSVGRFANYHPSFLARLHRYVRRRQPGRCHRMRRISRDGIARGAGAQVGIIPRRRGWEHRWDAAVCIARKSKRPDVADTSTPDRLASGDDVRHRLRMRRSLEHGTWAEVRPGVVDRAGGDRSSLTDRPELLVRVRDCETPRPDAAIPLVFSTTPLLSAGYPSLLDSPPALVFKSGPCILAINGMATLLLRIFSSAPFSLLSQLHYVMVRQCWSKLPIVSVAFSNRRFELIHSSLRSHLVFPSLLPTRSSDR